MVGDWVVVLLISVPAIAFGYWRYRMVKRWLGKKAAGVVFGVLGVTLCFGVYVRHEAFEAYRQDNPQALRYSSNPFLRRLFTPSAAPMTITDDTSGQEVFTYYRNDGAARLTALERPSTNEWLATLSINVSEPQNSKLKGWWETELQDDTRVLPLTRVFYAWNGDLRVEDVQTGQTLFTYPQDGAVRPAAVTKLANDTGQYEWQVLFTTGAGLVSQQ